MTRSLILAGLVVLAASPTLALSVEKSGAAKTTLSAPSPSSLSATESSDSTAFAASSLIATLSLQAEQTRSLDRLYEGYATRRLEQEARITRWQDELRRAQSPTSFDERKASRLLRDISQAQGKIEANLLSTRAQALKLISPAQREQLQELASRPEAKVRRDRYFQLLLMPVDSMEALPLARDARTNEAYERANPRRSSRRRGVASYGAYGGYGYGGAQYGVGAHYGRGPIGVHAGIGRGGPSVGVSIGGILGRRW